MTVVDHDLEEVRVRAEWYPEVRSRDAVPWYQIELALSDRRYLLAEVDRLPAELAARGESK